MVKQEFSLRFQGVLPHYFKTGLNNVFLKIVFQQHI